MKHEKFYYSTTNVPLLRRKSYANVVFALLMLCVVALNVFMLLKTDDLSLIENIASITTTLIALAFILFQIFQISQSVAIVKRIKKDGYVEADTLMMNFDTKMSTGNIIRVAEYVLVLITLVAVAGFVTYCVWRYIYFSYINYYIPLACALLITTYYSSKNFDYMYMLKKGL